MGKHRITTQASNPRKSAADQNATRKRPRPTTQETIADPLRNKSRILDKYPVLWKGSCPHKEKSNNILATLALKIKCSHCLVLDAATALTSRKLKEIGRRPAQIHVPNKCDDAYEALRELGSICTAYRRSVLELMEMKRNKIKFGVVYLDYCTTLDGGVKTYGSTPHYDIQQLFELDLMSPSGCVLAVTLCKPPDHESNEPQFCKVRNLITVMCVKHGLSVIFHNKNNRYASWITEFYIIGRGERIRRLDLYGMKASRTSSNVLGETESSAKPPSNGCTWTSRSVPWGQPDYSRWQQESRKTADVKIITIPERKGVIEEKGSCSGDTKDAPVEIIGDDSSEAEDDDDEDEEDIIDLTEGIE